MERQELVEGLACVDFTVLFADSTVEGIIRAIKPQRSRKGNRLHRGKCTRRELVRLFGGE